MVDTPTQTSTRRPRRRGLKTWSEFGELGRTPSQYEILTHGMNHTAGVGLELGPDVRGNRWLKQHRDGMAVQGVDWEAFRDPDEMTYEKYVVDQDRAETYLDGVLEHFDAEGDSDAQTTPELRDFLALVMTPSRYLVHCQQMLSAYIQQLAVSSYVGNCAVFQTADQLRRVQHLARRTRMLQLAHPRSDVGTADRGIWEEQPDWQPLRKAAEQALVEFDWDRAFVAANLVVKPIGDWLFLEEFTQEARDLGGELDATIAENLVLDSARSRRWTIALCQHLLAADGANQAILGGQLNDWVPRGRAMIDGGARLLATARVRTAEEIAQSVTGSWNDLMAQAGLEMATA